MNKESGIFAVQIDISIFQLFNIIHEAHYYKRTT